MGLISRLKRFGIDNYFFALLTTLALAALLPARGVWAEVVSKISFAGVMLLFFLYGAKLKPASILAGIAHLRLQSLIAACTYIVFPIVGTILASAVAPIVAPEIRVGIIFLAILPSTVQSSIAFTALARANVPAAVCAATLSNIAGVIITPLLAALLLKASGIGFSKDTVVQIALQILLPFALGQIARPKIGRWIAEHSNLTTLVDRGAILLIVYSAFSAGIVAGIWKSTSPSAVALVVGIDVIILAVLLAGSYLAGGALALPREDKMAALFCGSTKSLATGLPIAKILFAGQAVSLVVLPLLLFHQIQLLTCAVISQRQARLAAGPA